MTEIKKVCVDSSVGRGPSTRTVDDVSLRIGAGKIFGTVRTSGTGESMLLRTLSASTRPGQRSVEVNGVGISALEGGHLRKTRQRTDMTFQYFNLMYTRTMAQNAAPSLKAAGWERSKTGLRANGILVPVGLSDRAGRFPVQLSGEQKQRVGIVRTIVNHPGVLLRNESTSTLGLETSATTLTLLK